MIPCFPVPRQAFLLIACLIWAAPELALAQAAAKRNTACFNPKETEAEAIVRSGINLREILRRCAQISDKGPQALADWYKFDGENAQALKDAVALRSTAVKRIYPYRTLQEQYDNDATIATQATREVDEGVCGSAYKVVDRINKDKWKGFTFYAKLQEKLLVNEIPICPKP